MDLLIFNNQQDFWNWLEKNHQTTLGRWVKFDKKKISSSLTPDEALRCALCFGWIDSVIKKLDDQFYIKYFVKRSEKSIWSTKNKGLVVELIRNNLMMPSGYNAVNLAKQDGRWDKADHLPNDFDLDSFSSLLKNYPLAYINFLNFSPSIKKTYAMSYYALKKPQSKETRLKVIIDRLEKNLKPM